MSDQTSHEAFQETTEEIQKMAKAILAGVSEMVFNAGKSSKIHWGHVGDMNYAKDRLSEVCEHLRISC